MPVVSHVLIALGYTVVAGVAAIVLPLLGGVDGRGAVEVAGVIILICALVHIASARLRRGDTEAADIDAIRAGYADLRGELSRARDEARGIQEMIREALATRQGQSENIDTVMAEVRVMRDLVDQLQSGKKPKPKAPFLMDPKQSASAAAGPRYLTGLNDDEVLDLVREALKNNRVDLFVQPIVSLPQRKRRHYECFSRIRGEDDGILTPDQYIAIAEREGLMSAIDNMLLFRGVQLVRRLQKHNTDAGIFVNISEYTLADMKFLREFVAFMASNKDLAPYLVFELSQASLERHAEDGLVELSKLGRIGFRLSMDQVTNFDFDVAALGQMHVRFIKIDAALLSAQMKSVNQRLDMQAFKRVLDRHAIDLIVEKIEGEPQLLELLDHPIDFGQGYLFGEPRPSKDDAKDGV